MNIKVNVPILGKKAGELINPSDPFHGQFKSWAKNKDRNGGSVICELVEVKAENTGIDNNVPVPIKAKNTDETIESKGDTVKDGVDGAGYVCDVEGCDYIGKSKQAVHMHKVGKHRKE